MHILVDPTQIMKILLGKRKNLAEHVRSASERPKTSKPDTETRFNSFRNLLAVCPHDWCVYLTNGGILPSI